MVVDRGAGITSLPHTADSAVGAWRLRQATRMCGMWVLPLVVAVVACLVVDRGGSSGVLTLVFPAAIAACGVRDFVGNVSVSTRALVSPPYNL